MNLASKLKGKVATRKPKRTEPLWQGPEGVGPNGGITFSMLSRWLACRERFRLYAIEGLRPKQEFNARIEYGNLWHTCEEEHAGDGDWVQALAGYSRTLIARYPMQYKDIEHWYQVCKTQFPIYVEFWKKHPDVKQRTPLLQEQTFDVPYKLPSGRTVRLRGKWDSVDLMGKGKEAGIYLQENKTKGDIDEQAMQRNLTFDLQTMMYVIALLEVREHQEAVRGVRYNVIRRPLSGGKHSIRQHQATAKKPAESSKDFYNRLGGLIQDDAEYFFMRWKVEITPSDVKKFQQTCLDPMLEELCWWYEWVTTGGTDLKGLLNIKTGEVVLKNFLQWRYPFGVYNPALEGRTGDLDEFLNTGSELGLERVDTLFTELTNADS